MNEEFFSVKEPNGRITIYRWSSVSWVSYDATIGVVEVMVCGLVLHFSGMDGNAGSRIWNAWRDRTKL